MPADMTVDHFAEHSFGKAALYKLGKVPENFRLYKAGWLGKRPEEFTVMEVKGAEFRQAKKGKNAGQMTVMVPGTQRTVFVTKDEMKAFDDKRN